MGSLTLPCTKLVMQPCGFAGHWEVFSSGRGLVPTGRGGFVEGCCPARGSTLSPSPAVLSGQPRNLHLPRGGTQRGPVSHIPAAAPCPHHPVPLLAISPRSGGSCPSSCLLGNQWATHGPYLWASCGKGSLPSLSVGQLQTWGRGEPAPFLLCWGQGWGHCHCPH